jgi:hypothetical protein
MEPKGTFRKPRGSRPRTGGVRLPEYLNDLDLKQEYRSDEDNLVNDFYIPCLSRSTRYDRAVGYFTAEGLSLAARGIAELIKNGGTMRLVVGALLIEEDREQLLQGYLERLSKSCETSLEKQLRDIGDETIKRRIASLSWLVSNSRLEVKVAIKVDPSGKIKRGIYHEKMGVFTDSRGNRVAFSGSSNETPGGLIDNFESNDVYSSWRPAEESRVDKKAANFYKLWNDQTQGAKVLDFTRSVQDKLLPFRPITSPEFDPEDNRVSPPTNVALSKLEPKAFQLTTLSRWQENGFRGILSMATGTGKTFTAVKSVETFVPQEAMTTILLPGKEIADQWQNEILRELPGSRILQCHSQAPDELWHVDWHLMKDQRTASTGTTARDLTGNWTWSGRRLPWRRTTGSSPRESSSLTPLSIIPEGQRSEMVS